MSNQHYFGDVAGGGANNFGSIAVGRPADSLLVHLVIEGDKTTLRSDGKRQILLTVEQARAIGAHLLKASASIPPKRFTVDELRVGSTYERRDGRLVKILSIGPGIWGIVRYENVTRSSNSVPPQGKKSAHYFAEDLAREVDSGPVKA